jgi:hypothetical protein
MTYKMPVLSKEEFCEAISEGVHRAIRQVITTNGMQHDLYGTVEEGIRNGRQASPICTRLGGSEFRVDFGQMLIPDQATMLGSE